MLSLSDVFECGLDQVAEASMIKHRHDLKRVCGRTCKPKCAAVEVAGDETACARTMDGDLTVLKGAMVELVEVENNVLICEGVLRYAHKCDVCGRGLTRIRRKRVHVHAHFQRDGEIVF